MPKTRQSLIALAMLAVLTFATVAGVLVFQQRLIAENAAAAAQFTPEPIATVPAKEFVSVTVIGDSFTAGSSMGGKDAANWTQVMGRSLTTDKRTVQFTPSGLGGSGYVTVGPTKKTFLDAAKGKVITSGTDLIIFFGSINDIEQDPARIGEAAAASYAAARKAAPKAKLMVVGPAWPHVSRVEDIIVRRDAIKAAASKAGATFVDPLDAGWFQGSAGALIGSDGTHPTNEGHVYMAKLLTPTVRGALGL